MLCPHAVVNDFEPVQTGQHDRVREVLLQERDRPPRHDRDGCVSTRELGETFGYTIDGSGFGGVHDDARQRAVEVGEDAAL